MRPALLAAAALWLCAATPLAAAPVALVAPPELAAFSHCVAERLAPGGAVVDARTLDDGIELRFVPQREGGRIVLVAAVALLKAGSGPAHAAPDDEADDQAEAQRRIQALYRIHVGTRAWAWHGNPRGRPCSAAARWAEGLRRQAVNLDALQPHGEPGPHLP